MSTDDSRKYRNSDMFMGAAVAFIFAGYLTVLADVQPEVWWLFTGTGAFQVLLSYLTYPHPHPPKEPRS